jgi:hypothetical protein
MRKIIIAVISLCIVGVFFLPESQDVGTVVREQPVRGTVTAQTPAIVDFQPERAAATVGGGWVFQGPAPIQNGGVDNITDGEAVGAANTALAHPTNADIVWVGAVNGGVWKTENARDAKPTWVAQTDAQPSLSIGAMDTDPSDPTGNTLVAGFGRDSSFDAEGGLLNGMIRSSDGGASWTHLTADILGPESVSGIAARGSTLIISSNAGSDFRFGLGGLFRSTDTGATWSKIDGADDTGLPERGIYDMVGDPTDANRLYVTVVARGIYRSDDLGATWNSISSTQQVAIFTETDPATDFEENGNAEMSIASNGRLYVIISNSGRTSAIEYTDDPTSATPTWVAMDLPTTPVPEFASLTATDATNASPIVITTSAAHGLKAGNFVQVSGVIGNTAANGIHAVSVLSDTTFAIRLSTGNGAYDSGGSVIKVHGLHPEIKRGAQGDIHLSIVADRDNSNIVYVGGDTQEFPSFIDAGSFTGRIWRGDTSAAPTASSPSPQWAHMTHSNAISAIPTGGTASASSPHADSRELIQDVNGDILQTDDGGIYRRTSPTTNTGDWFSMNGNAGITEQHSIAYDTVTNVIVSGNQDNGTTLQLTPGGLTWREIASGDGGDVAIDTTTAVPNSIRYTSSQNNGGFARSTYDTTNTEIDFVEPALTGKGAWEPSFFTAIELNPVNQARFVLGGTNGILESLDKGDNATYLETGSINDSGLSYGASDNADALYAASETNVLVRISGAGAPIATSTQFPGEMITDLQMHPSTANTLYVIDASKVYTTTDAGATWSDITGNLTNKLLRNIEFLPGTAPTLLVGGVSGVSSMALSEPGVWNSLGSGLPNALVYDMDYDAADNVLAVATLGRGAWLLSNVVSAGSSRLGNISTRDVVRTGDEVVIGGVIITGDSPKTVVIRARGQSLADADPNLQGLLEDPFVQLFSGSTLIDSNDNWESHAAAANIRADLKPNRTSESAILATLDPGAYTAIVRGVSETTGIGIVEIFEIDETGTSRLSNISTRGFVGTGNEVLIGGVIITGTENKMVTIRARGPSLADADPNLQGLLADPFVQLFDSTGTLIDSNDGWESHSSVSSLREDLRPTRTEEAAITRTLAPGAYTAIVRGVGETTGIGIVEVFDVD